MNSYKSQQELQDTAYRSLRTRLNNFKETGTWPTGTHPFGYGKACYAADGTLRWVWQPSSRTRGQLLRPNATHGLCAAEDDCRLPRKERCETIKLVPHANAAFVESVRTIFALYATVGLSRRQISARLNQAGRRFYDRPFTV